MSKTQTLTVDMVRDAVESSAARRFFRSMFSEEDLLQLIEQSDSSDVEDLVDQLLQLVETDDAVQEVDELDSDEQPQQKKPEVTPAARKNARAAGTRQQAQRRQRPAPNVVVRNPQPVQDEFGEDVVWSDGKTKKRDPSEPEQTTVPISLVYEIKRLAPRWMIEREYGKNAAEAWRGIKQWLHGELFRSSCQPVWIVVTDRDSTGKWFSRGMPISEARTLADLLHRAFEQEEQISDFLAELDSACDDYDARNMSSFTLPPRDRG